MDWKVAYCVMTHNTDREVYRSFHRWEVEKWIADHFDNLVEFYIREVWTTNV